MSSLGRAPGAPVSPMSLAPAPGSAHGRGSPPLSGRPDLPPSPPVAPIGLGRFGLGPADSTSDDLVEGPSDSGSDPGSSGDDQMHPLAAVGIEDLPGGSDSGSDVGSFQWDLGSDSASIFDPFGGDGSSSDGTVEEWGTDDNFCSGLCWEAPQPPGHAPVKRTGAWYHYHRQCPILPGHQTTVMQACFSMCMLKDQHRVPDVVVDKLCGYIHHVLLSHGNMFPPSFHLMKAVAGVPPASSTEADVCDICWKVFPPANSGEHSPAVDSTCRRCGAARYKDAPHGGTLVPRRRLFNFGVQETLVDLLTRPGMVHAILDSRRDAWTRPESFWGSPAGRALNHSCSQVFKLPDTPGEVPDELAIAVTLGASMRSFIAAWKSGGQLPCKPVILHSNAHVTGSCQVATVTSFPNAAEGADGAQLFETQQYGAFVCGLKLQELHPSLASKHEAFAPLLLVEGPNEPSTVDSILEDVLQFFKKHDPGVAAVPCSVLCPRHGQLVRLVP